MNTSRRLFLLAGVATSASLALSRRLRAADAVSTNPPPATPPAELAGRGAPQDPQRVFEFVRAGHTNLARVKEMLAEDPRLVLASWDWGNGDWETALAGAAHLGNRELAVYLLEHGARQDLFCSAMLGEREVVSAAIARHPALANSKGPHGLSLLYHAAISGNVPMAEAIAAHLAQRARDFNQGLNAAARSGHVAMTTWLLANGVTDVNVTDGLGKTAATYAQEKNVPEIAELLRAHAAK